MSKAAPSASLPAPAVLAHASPARRVLCILKRTGLAFIDDNVTRLGAALAFYTTIAVAPLMVLSVAVAGFFLDDKSIARDTVVSEIRSIVGEPAAVAVASLDSPTDRPAGIAATVFGACTLVFGAFGVFPTCRTPLIPSGARARPNSISGQW